MPPDGVYSRIFAAVSGGQPRSSRSIAA
jgi:hypothetical protein